MKMSEYSEEGGVLSMREEMPQEFLDSEWNASFVEQGAVYLVGVLHLYAGEEIGALRYSGKKWEAIF